MPRFRRLARDEIRTKTGPLDLVTEADEAAERLITAGLTRAFPGCVVVGEERHSLRTRWCCASVVVSTSNSTPSIALSACGEPSAASLLALNE